MALLACTATGTPGPVSPPGEGEPASPTQPEQAVDTLDHGEFVISMAGAEAGRETFRIERHGERLEIHTDTIVEVGPQKVHAVATLVTDTGWRPASGRAQIQISGVASEQILHRDESGDLVLTTQTSGAAPMPVRAQEAVDLYIANNTIAHMAPLCHAAGAAPHTLRVFPGGALTLSARVEQRFAPATPGQPDRALDLIVLDFAGSARIEIYCDRDRLAVVRVPMLSGFMATRQGYEALAEVLARGERAKPETPPGLVEHERSVEVPAGEGVEPATLACSLMMPASHAEVKRRGARGKPRPLPAAVFISGSGPQDRDEDTPGPGGLKLSIFKVMAIALGQAGVASLRCDDRGTAQSTGTFETATLPTFVADARAMVAALRTEPAVNPDRIAIIGHSEGGIIGPLVAIADRRLGALVLMAATGRPLDEVLLEQIAHGARAQGLDEAAIADALARSRAQFEAIREGRPLPGGGAAAEEDQLARVAPWLRSHFLHDPAATARQLKATPVLIAQGARDVQVAVRDAEILRDTLAGAGNKRVTYKVYPDLNHLFAATRTGSMAEYSDPDAQVDPGFLADVVAFLKKHL